MGDYSLSVDYWNSEIVKKKFVKFWIFIMECHECVHYAWYTITWMSIQGFFSKLLMGELKIFGPRRFPTGTKSDGGGGTCKKKSDWSQMQN